MSGLIGNTEQMNFIGTYKGKFTIKVAEGTSGAVSRTNKNGKTVHEIQFNKLTGTLVDIRERATEDYGLRYQFIMVNDGEEAALELGVKDNAFSSIVNRLPNLNLQEEFEIVVKYNTEKEKSMYFINQNGESVEDKFQVYDPETHKWELKYKFPAWNKIKVNGEDVWDKSEQIEYQKRIIAELLTEVQNNKGKVSSASSDDGYPEPDEEESDEPTWK